MRDYQYKSHQWLAGKAWARSTPLGPFLVTPDEVVDPHALDITLDLNGERMQDANTRLFIFDIHPKVLLKDGDRIVVEISGVGRLENTVAAE
jgi:acylpyruvate hydrolase